MSQWFNLNWILDKNEDKNVDKDNSGKDSKRKGVKECYDDQPGNHSVDEEWNEDHNGNKRICFFLDRFDSPARSKENGKNRKNGRDYVEPTQINFDAVGVAHNHGC